MAATNKKVYKNPSLVQGFFVHPPYKRSVTALRNLKMETNIFTSIGSVVKTSLCQYNYTQNKQTYLLAIDG